LAMLSAVLYKRAETELNHFLEIMHDAYKSLK